jgi:cell division protein FtsQ
MNARVRGNPLVKLLAWSLALAVIALPIVGALNGWFVSDRWPFRQLRIDASFERVNAEQVRAAIAPRLEGGFFGVDLDAIRAAIEQIPWVERAEVRRRWPDTFEVQVRERSAAAVWSDGRLIDSAGELFAVPGNTVPEGLPRLSGPETRVADALAFQRSANAAMQGTGMALAELALSARGSWTVLTASGATLVLGREQASERLTRFLDAMRQIDGSAGLVLLRADLRYANGFAVQWQQTEPPIEPPIEAPIAPPIAPPIPVPAPQA